MWTKQLDRFQSRTFKHWGREGTYVKGSDVLLTVHLSIILVINQLNATNSFYLNKVRPTLMTLALLCQFTAQHVSDVNTSIFRSLRLLNRSVVVQPALGYHITNSQSSYKTPTRLKSAQYSLHNNASSRAAQVERGLSQPVHRTPTYRVWWYQMLYNTMLTFWWWAQQCSKHVEDSLSTCSPDTHLQSVMIPDAV